MKSVLLCRSALVPLALGFGLRPAPAAPVISEIMFHPAHEARAPEPTELEWFELFNNGPAIDASGWRLTRGVSLTFPGGTTIPANGYLIVAADAAAFATAHPGFAGPVVGGWVGQLSNSGEALELADASGAIVDAVTYFDDGDWAQRARSAPSLNHQGWEWRNPADGGGFTIEKKVLDLELDFGRNWKARSPAGGTPGASFATADAETVFITDVKTQPAIPRSTTPIVVTATIFDSPTGGLTPQWLLKWRLDGAPTFQTVPMTEVSRAIRGTGGAALDEVGLSATIPSQADKAIVEFYIDAQGRSGRASWPPPARTSDPGGLPETFAQAANCLIQVDNTYDSATAWIPGAQPIYRLVMTAVEAADLRDLQTTNGEAASEVQMNATFTAVDGTGTHVRYLCGLRNRGFSSAIGPPNNYHISFQHAEPWADHASLQFNCRFPHSQAIGAAIFGLAGLAVQECAPVQVRINGVNLAIPGPDNDFIQSLNAATTFGSYARVETLDSEWIAHHYPGNQGGNLYRVDDHTPGNAQESNRFGYPGSAAPDEYDNIYLKQTNQDLNDYSDLAGLFDVLNNEPMATLRAAVSTQLDLNQWLTYFAIDSLIGNSEGGLSAGRTDDFSMYRGTVDQRFILVPHDFDTTMSLGVGGSGDPVTRSIFSYAAIDGLTRLFNDPEVVRKYYARVLELLEAVFHHDRLDPLIDEVMGGWVDEDVIDSAKAFIDQRRENVLGQIPQTYSITSDLTTVTDGYRVSPTGDAVISGTFHVAQTRSIMVNGQPATMYYRATTNPTHAAGSWTLNTATIPGFLAKGITHVTAQFFDGPNGTGTLVHSESLSILNTAGSTMAEVSANGVPQATVLALEVPATYLPGVPFLANVELRDALGKVDQSSWMQSATLTASNGVTLAAATGGPAVVTLLNGRGSLLVMAGGGVGPEQILVQPGGTSTAPNATAALWKYLDTGAAPAATWKSALGFVDTTWLPAGQPGAPGQFGSGDNDERTDVANVSQQANSRKTWYFRHKFNVPSVAPFVGLTLKVVSDDGFAAYLNGSELKRQFLNPAAAHGDAATTARTAPSESAIESFPVPASALVAGENLLAVEVHNAASSADLSFDMALIGNEAGSDPGNLLLTATTGALTASRAMTSLGNAPIITDVTDPPAGETTWSGVVRLTGDVTVPAGATLTIAPATHVLIAGTAGANDSNGADLVVNGSLIVAGTESQPVSITAQSPDVRWGEILFAGGTGSTLTHALITRGAHSPGRGHTGRGPVLRLNGAAITLDSCVLSDSPGKAVFTQGSSSLIIRGTQIARTVTGPELEDGCELLVEDSHLVDSLPEYREGTNPVPDDEDTLYVHNAANRSVVVRHSVLGRCGDDVFDCLGGPITVENCIIRDGWDKGMSLLNNNLIISNTQIIGCDKAIVPKSDSATTRTITVTHCTIVSENHNTTLGPWGYPVNPSIPDPDSPSTGLYTQNKSGQSHADATIAITATNCIVMAMEPVMVDAPYLAAKSVVTYCDTRDSDQPATAPWPGTGNINGDPSFVSSTEPGKDFSLTGASPCRDTGDPASPNSPDGTRADMGAVPYGGSGGGAVISDIHWTLAQSLYHIAQDVTIAAGSTLTVHPGANVFVNQNRRITVNGLIKVLGNAEAHVTFSHVPGTIAAGDADPVAPGTQTGPAKWGGLRIVDSLTQENIVQYTDFVNAQGLSANGSENWGSLGAIRSWLLADHCTFSGSHLRLLYGRNAKLTVQYCTFPDHFGPNEDPITFGLDNVAEPLKAEFPASDAEVQNAGFVDGFPVGGWWRVYHNDFYGNKGHNDVFDADSGKWGVTTVLDCRYNHFHGVTGDEHIDLGGDAYIASNIFERSFKDEWTSDGGYANAISSGDRGTGTTIMVARNLFFDLDHAINCKVGTATIFEHNTAADFHRDYQYTSGPPNNINQAVKCSVVSLFIPEDTNPTVGYGGYLGFNLISNVARLVSGADQSAAGVGAVTSKIEFNQNLVDQIADTSIGANHPGGIFNPAYGVNTPGTPGFVDRTWWDYSLMMGSAAQGTAAGEFDYGSSIAEWAYILRGPAMLTPETTSTFTIGGPGIVAYKWRRDGGVWSAPITIGAGGAFPRAGAGPAVRQVPLTFPALAAGVHTLEVLGQDFAGNWQPATAPTTRAWTVDPTLKLVLINELVANDGANPDWVELINAGAAAIDLGGWGLGETQNLPAFVFPAGTILNAGALLQVDATASGLSFDKDGDAAFLFETGTMRDSIRFGPQVAGSSLSRLGRDRTWGFGVPTPNAPNQSGRVGSPSRLRLSEWLAAPSVRFQSDFLELHNEGPLPVALEGLRLTDNIAGAPAAHVMAAHSFIAAGGYLRLTADGNAAAGATHVAFRLEPLQERLSLLDSMGALIDEVYFYGQTDDMSQSPGDAGQPIFHELPTPGFAMTPSDPVFLNALALQRGLRITEIMFNAAGGNAYDWIELRNVANTAFNLEGVSFVQGIDFTFGNILLSPGQSLILVADANAFRNRYGAAATVGGTYNGRLDNGGETLALRLPSPFDANILSFRYEADWYAGTDGGGRSLDLANTSAAINTYHQKSSWKASAVLGGTPDGATQTSPTTYAQWKSFYGVPSDTTDLDSDGLLPILEFGLGLDPATASSPDGISTLPTSRLNDDARLEIVMRLPINDAAVQGHGRPEVLYEVQVSDGLNAWTTIATKTTAAPWTGSAIITLGPVADGFQLVTVEDITGSPSNPRRFQRLRTAWVP